MVIQLLFFAHIALKEQAVYGSVLYVYMYYDNPITVFGSYCPEGSSPVWISIAGMYNGHPITAFG